MISAASLVRLVLRLAVGGEALRAGIHWLVDPATPLHSLIDAGLARPLPVAIYMIGVWVQLGGGVMVLTGFGTRVAAPILAAFALAMLSLDTWVLDAARLTGAAALGRPWPLQILDIALLLAVAALGAGPLGLPALLRLRHRAA